MYWYASEAMVDLYCIRTYDTRMTFGDSTADVLLARYKWKKVEIPKPWTPSETGSKLTGFYGGKTSRQGSFGQYDVVIVHVPLGGARTVSGIQVLQLVDAAMIDVGDPICVVYNGDKQLAGDRHMKQFEVFVAEGEPIEASMLPSVEAPT